MPLRAAVTLAATVVAIMLMISFRTPPTSALSGGAVLPARPTPQPSSAPTATPSGAPPSGGTTPTASPTPTARPSGPKDGTLTGQDYPNQYGDVQVQVIISGSKITDVRAIQYPTDRPQSAFISQQALPLLHDEVLQAQSAQIDGVGGATFTSYSYAESVQSALAQAQR